MKLDTSDSGVLVQGKSTETTSLGMADQRLFIGMYRDQIYKNKRRVIPQEYICNARDAHREVGQTRPIEITLPTVLDPVLKIRDFGPGIDEERLKAFTSYGASTKRHSNAETGGFGIGCKCGFAYTESFMMNTVIEVDGKRVKRQYHLFITNKMDPGSCRLVSEIETEEDIGTEIAIPVMDSDINNICQSVYATVSFWKHEELPVIDGEEIEPDGNSYARELESKHYVVFNKSVSMFGLRTGEGWCIVDGICYPLDKEVLTSGKAVYEEVDGRIEEVLYKVPEADFRLIGHGKAAFLFNTGEVTISPSREDLDYDEKTIKAVQFAINEYKRRMFDEFKAQMDGCTTLAEAIRIVKANRLFVGLDSEAINLEWDVCGKKMNLLKLIDALKNQSYFSIDKESGHDIEKETGFSFSDRKRAVFQYSTQSTAGSVAKKMRENKACDHLDVDEIIIFFPNKMSRWGRDDGMDKIRAEIIPHFITHEKYSSPKTAAGKVNKPNFKSVGLYQLVWGVRTRIFEKVQWEDYESDVEAGKIPVFVETNRKHAMIMGKWRSKHDTNQIIDMFAGSTTKYEVYFVTKPGQRLLKKHGIAVLDMDMVIRNKYNKMIKKRGYQKRVEFWVEKPWYMDYDIKEGADEKLARAISYIELCVKLDKEKDYTLSNYARWFKIFGLQVPRALPDNQVWKKSQQVILDTFPLLQFLRGQSDAKDAINDYLQLIIKNRRG